MRGWDDSWADDGQPKAPEPPRGDPWGELQFDAPPPAPDATPGAAGFEVPLALWTGIGGASAAALLLTVILLIAGTVVTVVLGALLVLACGAVAVRAARQAAGGGR